MQEKSGEGSGPEADFDAPGRAHAPVETDFPRRLQLAMAELLREGDGVP